MHLIQKAFNNVEVVWLQTDTEKHLYVGSYFLYFYKMMIAAMEGFFPSLLKHESEFYYYPVKLLQNEMFFKNKLHFWEMGMLRLIVRLWLLFESLLPKKQFQAQLESIHVALPYY